MTCALPTSEDVKGFYATLVGVEVQMEESSPVSITEDNPTATAVFTLDDGSVGAIVVLDLSLALNSGAALSLIPEEEVSRKLEEGKVDKEVFDNVTEMMNMFANLFNKPDAAEVSFHTLGVTPAPVPDFLAELVLGADVRLDLAISIPDYGSGRMSFIAP